MKSIFAAHLITGVLCALIAPYAMAQEITDPPPDLEPGTKTRHLFTVPGVVNSNLETLVTCTSLESATIKIGVQFYNEHGVVSNDPLTGDGVLDVPSGWTVTFATGPQVGIPIFSMGYQVVGAPFGVGSARILATGKKVLCTARIISGAENPPTTLATLTLVKAKKQAGD